MSGQRIDDHSSWVGKAKSGEVFPEGVKVKTYSSAEGAGALSQYEDTSEAIHTQQEMGKKKIHSHGQKPHHRN